MLSSKNINKLYYKSDALVFLKENDECYYLFEYFIGKGYDYSDGNNLIINFKKSISKKDTWAWGYRNSAIWKFAQKLHSILEGEAFTIIPCPTSKHADDPEYNDRMVRLCEELEKLSPNYDIQHCIITTKSHKETHMGGGQREPATILEYTEWVEPTKIPNERVILIDDVCTTGAHFRAYCDLATKHLLRYDCKIAGIFLAAATHRDPVMEKALEDYINGHSDDY